MNNTLIVFGRLPFDHISAKTRLGKEMNNASKARSIGHSLTLQTLKNFSHLSCTKIFCYGGEEKNNTQLQNFQEKFSSYQCIRQAKNKDVRAMKEAFENTSGERKILIGTDIIGITPEDIKDCFEILHHYDVVIIPLEDKGYGLVGMSGNFDIFTEIQNFESRTQGYNLIQETQILCEQKNFSLFIFPKIYFDIDTLEEYERIEKNFSIIDTD